MSFSYAFSFAVASSLVCAVLLCSSACVCVPSSSKPMSTLARDMIGVLAGNFRYLDYDEKGPKVSSMIDTIDRAICCCTFKISIQPPPR